MGNKINEAFYRSFFPGKTPTEAMEALKDAHCDVFANVGDPQLVTVGSDTYVSVKAQLIALETDRELILGHDVKFVKVKHDLDDAYVQAKDGVLARMYEDLGCKVEIVKNDDTKPKKPRKARSSKEENVVSEATTEEPQEITEQQETTTKEVVSEIIPPEEPQKETEPETVVSVVEPGRIMATIITPFVLKDEGLCAEGTIADGRTAKVIIPAEKFDLIKRSMSLNCFIKRQHEGTTMKFIGCLRQTEDGLTAVLVDKDCQNAEVAA